ncbi:STP1 protein [Plasmodium malariae]|uniref:STP1 protein n=1 Tax=Plasmodium malariae TaxID=5858 RepID=A0A1D3JJZ4_PLAMA|nr:STP1 protein [Plasmodium malariae]SBT86839.1 STP1 protein [Plasmodium malariae]
MGASQSIFSKGERLELNNWVTSHNIVNKIKYIISKTSSLSRNGIKKEVFRKECLNLVNFLIIQKNARPNILSQRRWEVLLKEFLSRYFNKPTKHGICPFILKEDERDLLRLSYTAHDFCEEKNSRLKSLKPYETPDENFYKCNREPECIDKFKEYNAWIQERRVGFYQNSIFKKSLEIPPQIHFPTDERCNVFRDKTFHELVSADMDKFPYSQDSYEGKEICTEDILEQSSTSAAHTQIDRTTVEQESQSSDNSEHDIPLETEAIEEEISKIQSEDISLKKDIIFQVLKHLETPQGTIHPLLEKMFLSNDLKSDLSTYNESVVVPNSIFQYPLSIITLQFNKDDKKKKTIKKRQVKLLRIVTPLHAARKSKFLTHEHEEDFLHNDEKIIKNIKIHEHNVNKNTKISKRKKDRTKTIIEIHMEVLEEFRNEEWKSSKGEFLSICIEQLTNEKYNTHSHLTKDELIMENIKRLNDVEQQKFLWNKWIERHGNLSEILKKENCFNNLKNEWKKELQDYVEKMKELEKKSSNENHNFSFLRREKDIWKQWILKKGTIVEQYLKQDWFKKLEEELQNRLYTFEIAETIYDVSLINMEELVYKECYQELYKYVKKKVLVKLCILLFMMVLEECKKEEYIYNRESYFDISINEWKTEMNLAKKSEIEKNITDVNKDVLENKENMGHIREDNFKKEIDNWISKDDTNVNFTVNDEELDKTVITSGKYIL